MDKIYVKQANDLISTHSYLENLDFILSPFGFAFRKVKLRRAIHLYEKAISHVFDNKLDPNSIGGYYMEIGYLYGILNEPLKSADHYLKSAENYSTLDKAFSTINIAIELYSSQPINKMVDCYKLLSDLYYKMDEYAECAKYLDKCIYELNRNDFSNKRIGFYEKLAFIYLVHLNRPALALTMCEEIVKMDKTDNRKKYLEICEYLRKDDLASSRQLIL